MSLRGCLLGSMNKQIVVESNSPSTSSTGSPVESWSTFTTIFAERINTGVAERFTGQQFVGFRGIVWRIHVRTDITNLMRVVYNSQNYDIHGVYEHLTDPSSTILVTEALISR